MEENNMVLILLLVYLAAGYWAVGETIWKNKVLIEFKLGGIFLQRVIYAAVLGWLLIPVAIIRKIFHI